MKEEKLKDMKGRKSVFHYDKDGNIRYIEVVESDEPFFSDDMYEVVKKFPDFLRHRHDGKNVHEVMAQKMREHQEKEPTESYDPKDYDYLDIPEFLRRKE